MSEQSPPSDAVKREERILAFWKENRIFEKSLEKPSPKGEFVFYEGPPTANGRPGIHHLESRAFKDAIPRYKTMRGYHVGRRAGWDTHGLPVELEVEKQLGFSGKKQIEEYGVAAFNQKCRESVMTYIEEWSRFTERIGYWVDQQKAYFTFDASYMESLFAIVKKISNDGRLFKDYRIVPWCSRCGTALSSHELAQGYQEVKDLSVTVKFKVIGEEHTYLLAWTTTPWTLAGNVALVVGKDIVYGKYTNGTERVVVAKERSAVLGDGWTLEEEIPGEKLVGTTYEPLYPFLQERATDSEQGKFEKAYHVYTADFVTTEEGTGIVHTAVMYGADDFSLGTRMGLPKTHLVGADGTFISGTGFLEGRFVKEEDANGKPTLAVDIIDDLKKRNLFFSQENHKHTYPFCWRCQTPLIYYARDSWYIRMHDLSGKLLAENKNVHWEPNHIRDGRMGEWLTNVKDWAISRERYWGTPLPVWETPDGSERVVLGSIEELRQRTKKSGNTYFVMRHGEAESNVQNIFDSSDEKQFPLTEKGRAQVSKRGKELKVHKITKIFSSPFIRTKQTAEIVAGELGIPAEEIVFDKRIQELQFGTFEGKDKKAEYLAYRAAHPYDHPFPGGESYQEVKRRLGSFLYDIEQHTTGENILIVTHGIGSEVFPAIAAGATKTESKKLATQCLSVGEVRNLPFIPLPHNDDYELDLHRPHIDEVILVSDSGKELRRVKEVMDVWFDSGAMPFAQDHYPFENKKEIEKKGYPADYISEAIDQTRGWFYTLLAVGTLMNRGAAYKNVICLGHLLDAQGQKMSKSKGNVVNPWDAIAKYGADTLRFWMYYVNQPGDSKNFDDKTVKETARVLSWLENSAKFYELFKTQEIKEGKEEAIDQWMRIRVDETVWQVTKAMDAYRPYEATRSLASLFEDLSQWYVRRIRDRVREGDAAALATLYHTLHTSSQLLAPFAPFLAEEIFQTIKTESDPESVHVSDWPEKRKASFFTPQQFGVSKKEARLVEGMKRVRELASEALRLRQQQDIKVRQPLASLSIAGTLSQELCALLAEEINVKEIVQHAKELALDATLTPTLIVEGDERAQSRAVADARKQMGLLPKDAVTVSWGSGPYSVELSTGTVSFSVTRNEA